MLARREYSAAALRAKLAQRGCQAGLVEIVLQDLRAAGWQDDERYAESLVRTRLERGDGPLAIRQRLRQAGIDDPAALAGDRDWYAVLAAAYRKKYGDTYPDSREEYARRGRFLQGRGYAVEQIRDFFRQLRQQHNDS